MGDGIVNKYAIVINARNGAKGWEQTATAVQDLRKKNYVTVTAGDKKHPVWADMYVSSTVDLKHVIDGIKAVIDDDDHLMIRIIGDGGDACAKRSTFVSDSVMKKLERLPYGKRSVIVYGSCGKMLAKYFPIGSESSFRHEKLPSKFESEAIELAKSIPAKDRSDAVVAMSVLSRGISKYSDAVLAAIAQNIRKVFWRAEEDRQVIRGKVKRRLDPLSDYDSGDEGHDNARIGVVEMLHRGLSFKDRDKVHYSVAAFRLYHMIVKKMSEKAKREEAKSLRRMFVRTHDERIYDGNYGSYAAQRMNHSLHSVLSIYDREGLAKALRNVIDKQLPFHAKLAARQYMAIVPSLSLSELKKGYESVRRAHTKCSGSSEYSQSACRELVKAIKHIAARVKELEVRK